MGRRAARWAVRRRDSSSTGTCGDRRTAAGLPPHGLASYVFWVRADEGRLDDPAGLPLYTSGPEVDRAVVAACADPGLTALPGPLSGVLMVAAR
jgi:hypothetical protein